MKHKIEITTVDALLLCYALNEENFDNDVDKEMAKRLKDLVTKVVTDDLKENDNVGRL